MLATANYPVILDACVLVPPALCDLFLRLAETPRLYAPKWTAEILDEVTRNQPLKTKMSSARIATWRAAVESAFPEAMVTLYEPYLEHCGNQEKDRHVLAAAVREKAHTIVTFNLGDFKKEHLEPWQVVATHPSDFLTTLHEHRPSVVTRKLVEMASDRDLDLDGILRILDKTVPGFSNVIRTDQA